MVLVVGLAAPGAASPAPGGDDSILSPVHVTHESQVQRAFSHALSTRAGPRWEGVSEASMRSGGRARACLAGSFMPGARVPDGAGRGVGWGGQARKRAGSNGRRGMDTGSEDR